VNPGDPAKDAATSCIRDAHTCRRVPRESLDPDRETPIVVRSTYTVAPEDEERFLRAVTRVRRSRLRTGTVRWGLYRDGQNPRAFVELYVVPSWEEHMRQHTDRLTGAGRAIRGGCGCAVASAPETSHLIEAKLPEGSGRTPRSERGYPPTMRPRACREGDGVDDGMEG